MSDEIASSGGEVPGAMTPARRANMARLFEPRSIVFLGGLRASAAIRTTRQSGFGGRDNSIHAHDQYTQLKTIWIDLTDTIDAGVA